MMYKNEWMQLRWFDLISKKPGVILNRAKGYCENDKDRLRVLARDK